MSTTALLALDLSPAERPIIDCIADLRPRGVGRVTLAQFVPIGCAQGGGALSGMR